MEYAIGVSAAAAVGLFATVVGFDKERSFYPVVLIVIAALYLLFAAMASSTGSLVAEAMPALAFVALAVLGFRTTLWFVVAGLALHGVFDFFHDTLIENPGVPVWWPGWCLAYDVAAAAYLAGLILVRGSSQAAQPLSAAVSTRSGRDADSGTLGSIIQALELKVPPVPLTAIFAGAMYGLSLLSPLADFTLAGSDLAALVLLLLGAAIALAGVMVFRASKTTVNPLTPGASTTVVSTGVYRFSRNPMYLGFLLVLAAWAVYLSNALAVMLLPAFVVYVSQFQIKPEERALLARFGARFSEYMVTVRRWV